MRTVTETLLPSISAPDLLKRSATTLSQSSGWLPVNSEGAAISRSISPLPWTVIGKVLMSARVSATVTSSE